MGEYTSSAAACCTAALNLPVAIRSVENTTALTQSAELLEEELQESVCMLLWAGVTHEDRYLWNLSSRYVEHGTQHDLHFGFIQWPITTPDVLGDEFCSLSALECIRFVTACYWLSRWATGQACAFIRAP